MKKIAVKVVTIFSQLLVVTLFLCVLFKANSGEEKKLIVNNNNFNKMADMTTILFKEEDNKIKEVDENVISPFEDEKTDEEKAEIENPKEEVAPVQQQVTNNTVSLEPTVLQTVVGNLTGYGANCYGCSGKTYSGFDLSQTMYYDDYEYGTVRILAADPSFPIYSIFRVSNVPGMEPFIAIVLDRGGNVGYGRGTLFDLAYVDEKDPTLINLTPNVTFELLRSGN